MHPTVAGPQLPTVDIVGLATHLLPLHGVVVQARFTGYSQPSLFHEPALRALLKTASLGDLEDEPLITLIAPESGRAHYRAGDGYRFELIAAHPAVEKLSALLHGLGQSHQLSPADPRVPFGRQFRIEGFTDPGTGSALADGQSLPTYGIRQWQLEQAFWRNESHVRVRLQSPLRILRAQADRDNRKGEARFINDATELRANFLGRVWNSLGHLARHLGYHLVAPPSAPLAPAADAFFIDWDYRSGDGTGKPMGGLLGWLDLDLADGHPDWLLALLLAQRLGIGQRRNFGWGRFRLESAEGRGTMVGRQRLIGVLQRAAEPDNLRQALVHALAAGDCPEALRDCSPSAVQQGAPLPPAWQRRLDDSRTRLIEGDYPVPDLHGQIVFADSGKARPLAVPPWFDRVIQRAVHQVLASDFESLMNDSSFGYRRGRSRIDVKQRIQQSHREGYRWYFEADIAAFFDSVDHRRLHTRLAALLGDDPVQATVLRWMAAPVEFMQRRIERDCGLPQGAPLSPLMANLMLEDIDAEYAAAGLRLLRYADDFVVLCKQREDAERAHHLAEQTLADLGLSLKPEKTRIGRLGHDGLEFLGFRFLGDLAVDRQKPTAGVRPPLHIPERSWLAALIAREPSLYPHIERRYLGVPEPPPTEIAAAPAPMAHVPSANTSEPQPLATRPEIVPPVPPASDPAVPPVGQADAEDGDWLTDTTAPPSPDAQPDEGQWLCLLDDALIAQRQGRLCVLTQASGGHDFAWSQLEAVLVFGHSRITSGAIHAALDNDVPLHFFGGSDGYRGCLGNPRRHLDDLDFVLLQRQRFADSAFTLDLARSLVAARIHNQRETLRQRLRDSADLPQWQAELSALMQQLGPVTSRNQLNGYEGQASHRYLKALATCLNPPFAFHERNRRPPRDPVNALLSLGYTVLYTRTAGLIQAEGLHPRLGFYHQPHGRHATLASDLMEPFRHLVERSTWTLINRRQVTPDDFITTDAHGCRISPRGKRLYLARLAEAFARRQTTAENSHGTWFQLMRQQLKALRGALLEQQPPWFYRMR